jgi:hypothetical protein
MNAIVSQSHFLFHNYRLYSSFILISIHYSLFLIHYSLIQGCQHFFNIQKKLQKVFLLTEKLINIVIGLCLLTHPL